MSTSGTQDAVADFLAAIESLDPRAVEGTLASDVTWQNVPHPAVEGRDAVVSMLRAVLTWSERARWDVVTASYGDGVAWLERIDRFRIDGSEFAVRCNGVFDVDTTQGTIRAVRDYVDLGEWRSRLAGPMEQRRRAPAVDVVRRHLDAVQRRDPVAMVADYADDARLDRIGQGAASTSLRGWREIARYFDDVPDRLEAAAIRWDAIEPDAARAGDERPFDIVRVEWSIHDAVPIPTPVASTRSTVRARGTDLYRVTDGRIVEQTVRLDTPDF